MQISRNLANAVTLSESSDQEPEADSRAPLLLFSEASKLARNGYYPDAELLVRQSLCTPSGLRPALWNLLAKIYAQQGRYMDAESCWREALVLAPGTLEYLEGIQTIARESLKRPIAAGLKWVVASLLFAVFGYAGMAIHEYLQQYSPDGSIGASHQQTQQGTQPSDSNGAVQ